VKGAKGNYTVSNTFTQKAEAKKRPWDFYWWTTQGPHIREPLVGDDKANTKADAKDRQIIPVGKPAGVYDPIVTAGADGILQSKAAKGDESYDLIDYDLPYLFANRGANQPLIKYDKIHKTKAWSKEAQISDDLDKQKRNPQWAGHCLGGAMASIFLDVP